MNFSDSVKRTLNTTDKKEAFLESCLGIASESGEIVNLLKKHVYQGHPLDTEKVKEEVGDELAYLEQLSLACGFSIFDAMHDNILKRMKRFPKGFTTEYSINRIDTK